jgi:hypothetical protein
MGSMTRRNHESIKPLGGAPRLQPLVHVENMAATVAFYEALGGVVRQGSRDGDWVLMGIGWRGDRPAGPPAEPRRRTKAR